MKGSTSVMPLAYIERRCRCSPIPSAKLVVFESGGHLLVNRYGEVSRAIDAFLSRTVQSRSKQSSWQRLRNANDDTGGSK